MSNTRYQRVEVSDASDLKQLERNTTARSCPHCQLSQPTTTLCRVLPWALFVISSILLLTIPRSFPYGCGNGNAIEPDTLDPDQDVIPAFPKKIVTFHGSPEFHPNGTGYIPSLSPDSKWPENINYFAEPSDMVDAAWDRILGNVSISISPDEARRAWGKEYSKYRDLTQGGFTAVPDVIHTLHCLDAMRRAKYPDRYSSAHGPEHLDHCMDYLRQSILCYTSTKLIPTRYRRELYMPYIDVNQPHTCNDISAIRQWMEDRAPGAKSYMPRQKWQ